MTTEIKVMSKPPRSTASNKSKPDNSSQGVPMIIQPSSAAAMNRRGSWSNPPKLPKPDPQPVIKLNKQPPVVVSPSPPSSTSASSDTTTTTFASNQVDSALLAALRDPRERIGLLRLEQTFIDFVMKQPQDSHMDVGGPYNSIVKSPTLGFISTGGAYANKSQTSFQRCILHRLADRFEITRENNMDGTIRLLKQTQTKIPSRLLLDVKPEEYSLVQGMEQVSLSTSTNNNGNTPGANSKANATSGVSKPKTSRRNSNEISLKKNSGNSEKAPNKNTKMKIMKRANSCPVNGDSMHRTNSSASLKKKNSSLTDREKAYAEARARIFQEEQQQQQQEEGGGDETSEDVTAPTTTTYTVPNTTSAPPSMQHVTTSVPVANGGASTPPESTSSTPANTSTVAPNSKATFRDRNQDEIDPDFRRGSQLKATTTMEYDHYVNPTKDYYGYYNATQHYPRNPYAQPQPHAWVPMPTTGNGTASGGGGQQQQQQQQAYHAAAAAAAYQYHQQQQQYRQQQQQYPYPTTTSTQGQHATSFAHVASTTAAATSAAQDLTKIVANTDSG